MQQDVNMVIVGSVNMDLILGCERIPHAGETYIGEQYTYLPGGKGANQAVAASLLGAHTTFVGKVGGDANGEVLLNALEQKGVNTDYIEKDPAASTGLAAIMLEVDAQNRILLFPGANSLVSRSQIENVFREYDQKKLAIDAILLQFEIPADIVIKTCKMALEREIPTIVDIGLAQDFPLEELYGVTILSPNETETYALTGIAVNHEKDCLQAAQILQNRTGASVIVIKLGAKGAYVYAKSQMSEEGANSAIVTQNSTRKSREIARMFPAIPVDAVDPTAAGDAFTAALTMEYIRTNDIEHAVAYASAVGALTVTKLGAQASLPTKEEVERFIARTGI